ncbi:hypothetical protein MVEG_02523 [Podila verticillata NRRL 6337]|nr:hypothetical protein MVEG_02523 [Podila verticillata NRRL 6337]
MAYYQIARIFNLGMFVAILLYDIAVSMINTQDERFLALFYSDYLAIVLITVYAVSDLSEMAHMFLSLYTFVASFWCIFVAVDLLYDVVIRPTTVSLEGFESHGSESITIITSQTRTVVFDGEPSTALFTKWTDPFCRPVLRRLNFGFGLALVVKAIVVLVQRIEPSHRIE